MSLRSVYLKFLLSGTINIFDDNLKTQNTVSVISFSLIIVRVATVKKLKKKLEHSTKEKTENSYNRGLLQLIQFGLIKFFD